MQQLFVYDGKTLALYNPKDKACAQVAAPDTLEAMLELARTKLDIVAPAGDLLNKNAYDILMDGVTDGFAVGSGDRGRALRPVCVPRAARRLANLRRRARSRCAPAGDHHATTAQRARSSR